MKGIYTLSISLLLVFYFNNSFSQTITSEYKKNFQKAEMMLDNGNFQEAILIYSKLLQEQPENANLNFKMGYCYLYTVLEKDKAITYLEKAIADMSAEAQPENVREVRAPQDALLFLAKAYHHNYNFSKALTVINDLKEAIPDYKNEFEENIDLLETYCKNGELLMQYPVKMHVTNLGGTINSEFDEHSPVFSADESVLIFTSKRGTGEHGKTNDGQYFEDIYISNRLKDGQWEQPKSISTNVNTSGHEASIGLSVDGSLLFIYKDDGSHDGNIYASRLQGDTWTVPEKMGGEINTEDIETHASISADNQELYFTSNRPGGLGGMDIYVVKRLPNGDWSSAQNLGPNVNTQYDEEGPFIHPDGVTLFFSSEGHMSMGDFDIFFTSKDENGNWTEPTNIGYPINTTADDVFYMPTPDGRRAYYASHQTGGIGRNDIYLITLPQSEEKSLTVMSGLITLADGNPPQNVTITVTDIETKELAGVYTPNSKTGKYLFVLKSGKDYNVTVEADNFLPFSENLMVKEGTSYQEIQRAIMLNPIVLGDLKKDYTFTFKPNSPEMDNKHLTEMPIIAKMAKILPEYKIEIITPENAKDEKLNANRADLIKENLIDKEVSEKQILISKGKPSLEKSIRIYISGDDAIADKTKSSTADINAQTDKSNPEPIKTETKTVTENTNPVKTTQENPNTNQNKIELETETIQGYVLFDFNKAETQEFNSELNKIADFLKKYPNLNIIATGHTDNQGSIDYNMQLSKRRAKFVQQYLINKGVKSQQIVLVFKGKSEPVAIDETPSSRKFNRRVELQLQDQSLPIKIKKLEVPAEFKNK